MRDNDLENLDAEFNEIFSKIIKKARIDKGYSLDDVVNKLNNIITKQSLYRYENNEARMKKGIYKKICKVLDIDPTFMYDEASNNFVFNFNEYASSEYELADNDHNEFKQILKDKNLMDTQENIDLSRLQEMLDLADKVEQLTKRDDN